MRVWSAWVQAIVDRLAFLCLTTDTQLLELVLGLQILLRGLWIVVWESIPWDSAFVGANYGLLLGVAPALIWGMVLSLIGLIRVWAILTPSAAHLTPRFWCAVASTILGCAFVTSFVVVRPASLAIPFHLSQGVVNAFIAARLYLLRAEREHGD